MKTILFALYSTWLLALPGPASASTVPGTNCDTLITKDGMILLVHIKLINKSEIRYTRCDDSQNGGLFAMSLANIKTVGLASHGRPRGERDVYRAFVRTKRGAKTLIGYLYSTTDSSIQLVRNPIKPFQDQPDKWNIPANEISRIKIQKKGRFGKSLLIGIGVGAGGMALAGYISGDAPNDDYLTKKNKALYGLLFGGILGAAVGFFIGIGTKSVRFDGSPARYPFYRAFLKKYTITGQ